LLIGLFKNKNPLEYVFLLFYTFLFYGILFFKVDVKPVTDYSFLLYWLPIDPAIIPKNYFILFSILLAYIQTVLFFSMIRKFGLSNDQSLISAFVYITLTGFFPDMIMISPSTIAFLILILAIYNLFLIYDIENPVQKFFFVSLYIGIGTIIYSPLCVFLLFLIIALPALKTPTFRELLIIIIGFLMPVYFLCLYFIMMDQLPLFNQIILKNIPDTYFSVLDDYQLYLVPLLVAGALFLKSILNYFFQSGSRTIRILIYNRILITCIIISIGIFIVIPANHWLMGPFILAPASVYIGNMLADDSKRIFNQVAFSVLFIMAVYLEYIFYYNNV
jgi:hypothetical protein